MKDFQEFDLGNVKLLSGKILNAAKLVYKTYGNLNKDHSNVILLPTFYTGTHIRNEGFIGKKRAINPNIDILVDIPGIKPRTNNQKLGKTKNKNTAVVNMDIRQEGPKI